MFLSTAFSLPESPSSEIFHMYLTLQTPHLPFNRFLSSSLSPPSYRVERRGDICRLMINMTLRSAPRALQTPTPPPPSCLRLFSPCILLSLSARWCVTLRLSLSLYPSFTQFITVLFIGMNVT